MDAGISLKTVLVSVSCSLDKENKLLLDPCKSEEEVRNPLLIN
jgi:ribonuclease PH